MMQCDVEATAVISKCKGKLRSENQERHVGIEWSRTDKERRYLSISTHCEDVGLGNSRRSIQVLDSFHCDSASLHVRSVQKLSAALGQVSDRCAVANELESRSLLPIRSVKIQVQSTLKPVQQRVGCKPSHGQ